MLTLNGVTPLGALNESHDTEDVIEADNADPVLL
jgi:hypothetical protein